MKKKNKQKTIIIMVMFAFIFPIMVKVLNLNANEAALCIAFYGLVVKLFSNFKFGEALLAKLSIIT